MTSVVLPYHGLDIFLGYEDDGRCRWTVYQDGFPEHNGHALQTGRSETFQQAVVAAKRAIDTLQAEDPAVAL